METPAPPELPPPPPELPPAPPATSARGGAPRFDPPNILWYFGAIAATFASFALISDVGPEHRGIWIFLVALVFFAGAAGLSAFALRFGCWVPGGVMAASAVVLFPTVIAGFEHVIGVWPKSSIHPFSDFCGVPFSLAVVTIVAGLAAFWLVRFGFVLLPVAVAAEFAVQFLLPVVVNNPSADDHVIALLITGAAFVVIGMLLDARLHRSAAFWWHVLGLFAIADGLAYYVGRSAVDRFLPFVSPHNGTWAWVTMFVIGAVLVVASYATRRATWAAFGVVGLYVPSFHYLDNWSGSWHFPLLLVVLGVALVFLGAILDVFGATWPQRIARPVLRRPP
jgi:hypothetical protein